MNKKEKVHYILNNLEKECSYLELKQIDIEFDKVYYFIAEQDKYIIDQISKWYNVKIKIIK